MAKKQIKLLGFSIDTSINELGFGGDQVFVSTINPHSYCVSKKDNLFREALLNSDILIPDGIGIVIAARLLRKSKIRRITGADLHEHILEIANKESAKVFYLGSSSGTLQKIESRLKKEYPNILFNSYSPSYKPEFSIEENQKIINVINAFQPNVVFIGMTAPKQEKWGYKYKHQLDTNVIASIGAVFDFYAGSVKRAPKWMQRIGLEWMHRSLSNPKKLGKRNILSNPKFIWDVITYKDNK